MTNQEEYCLKTISLNSRLGVEGSLGKFLLLYNFLVFLRELSKDLGGLSRDEERAKPSKPPLFVPTVRVLKKSLDQVGLMNGRTLFFKNERDSEN